MPPQDADHAAAPRLEEADMAIAEGQLRYADIDRRADQRARRKLREELNLRLTKPTRQEKLRRAIEPNQYRSPGYKAAALLFGIA